MDETLHLLGRHVEMTFLICLFLMCLLPVAIYFLILAAVNRQHHPVAVSGPWDFGGVLLAASGFLLVGGPLALRMLTDNWRTAAITASGWRLGDAEGLVISAFFLLYFIGVIVGASYVLLQRRASIAIYNVDVEALVSTLAAVFDSLRLRWTRTGNRFFIQSADANDGRPLRAVLRVDPFLALHHVTLHWESGSHQSRGDIEEELRRALRRVSTRRNPAGGWFMSAAATMILFAFFGLVGLFFIRLMGG